MPNRDQMKEVYAQIGQQLKNTRLKRGLSLEKISNKTKISIQNLEHIENGKGYLIAGEFYQRSFIKSYSKALRIDEKKFLLALDNSLKKESEQEIDYKKKELAQEKNKITNEKIYHLDSGEYVYPITKQLIFDGRKNKVLNSSINLKIHIVLLHGLSDKIVPLSFSKKIFKVCKKSKKKLIKIKNGNHTLSRKNDLKKICKELYKMVNII